MKKSDPITTKDYDYHLSSNRDSDKRKVYVKAIRKSDQSEYTGKFNLHVIDSYNDIVNIFNIFSAKQKGGDINTLLNLLEPDFADKVNINNNYDATKDIIRISCGPVRFSKNTYSFELHKYINHDKITANRLAEHEHLLEKLCEDNNKYISKISDLEKIIQTMKEEISSLKKNTTNKTYFVDIEQFEFTGPSYE